MNKKPNELHESIDEAVKDIADIFRNTGTATDSSEPIGYDLGDWFPKNVCIKCEKVFTGGRSQRMHLKMMHLILGHAPTAHRSHVELVKCGICLVELNRQLRKGGYGIVKWDN